MKNPRMLRRPLKSVRGLKHFVRKDIFTPAGKGEYVVETLKRCSLIMAIIPIVLVLLSLTGSHAGDKVPPRVIATNPQNGARDIDPSITEISVTFNERMMDKSWSWCYEDRDTFPQMTGQPYYVDNNTKNVLPVKLEPKKEYIIWINTVHFKNFRDEAGNPTVPYRFTFKTR